MCLIILGIKASPRYKLILAANRDEFYDRPTLPIHFWDGEKNLLAGKDLKEGGTWMGITKEGKIAAITNYRDMRKIKDVAPSRGVLVLDYLKGNYSDSEYGGILQQNAGSYNGYNLIWGSINNLYYFSNQLGDIVHLNEGIYGVSNHLLDTDWFKLKRGKQIFTDAISGSGVDKEKLFEMLTDANVPPESELPDTGLPVHLERLVSSIFIKSDMYGTRASTILLVDNDDNVEVVERYLEKGEWKKQNFNFKINR